MYGYTNAHHIVLEWKINNKKHNEIAQLIEQTKIQSATPRYEVNIDEILNLFK